MFGSSFGGNEKLPSRGIQGFLTSGVFECNVSIMRATKEAAKWEQTPNITPIIAYFIGIVLD